MTQTLISKLGETDQLFLTQNTPELALVRGKIRLELIKISRQKQEKIYFLQQTIAILEQARIEFTEAPLELHLDLSIELAKAYLAYFEISQEARFALICEQILKPLAHYQHSQIYELLHQSSLAQNHPAMAKHWQNKLAQFIENGQSKLKS